MMSVSFAYGPFWIKLLCAMMCLIIIGNCVDPSYNGQHTGNNIIKTKRLPPQIAYAGKKLRIDMSDFFRHAHDKHLNYILYTLDESEDGKRIDNPSWITFDHSVPYLEALPPKNLSDLSAVYTLRVMAMTAENQEIAEEELILVVAHSCFKKCPKHFGIGCEDWELWMIMAGIYGFFLLIVGWCLHGCIVALWERNLNAHRKQFMEQNTDPRERALMIEKDFYFDDDLDWNGKKKKTKCQKCLRNVQYFIWTKVLVLRPK